MKNHIFAMDENNGSGKMENVILSEATREKVEEAMLSVFMEQYGNALDAVVEDEMVECEDVQFPAELDKRIQKLLSAERAKKEKAARRKSTWRVLRSVAAVFAVLLCVSSVLFMTVEAFRVPVMNFFVEKTDRYWQLSGIDSMNEVANIFNPENPLDGIIPGDYELVELHGTVEGSNLFAAYRDMDNRMIYFYVDPSPGMLQVDTEGAQVTHMKVNGHDAYTCVEGEFVSIVWFAEDISKTFSIYGSYMTVEALTDYAESIASLFD